MKADLEDSPMGLRRAKTRVNGLHCIRVDLALNSHRTVKRERMVSIIETRYDDVRRGKIEERKLRLILR